MVDHHLNSSRQPIRPGQVWTDTSGHRIQAHGGSIFHDHDGVFYWYGENKEHTTPGGMVWHWGVRAYASNDLTHWTDQGLIVPPVLDDEDSPLHPAQWMDRPHILFNVATGKYVCWVKVMKPGTGTQELTVLTADSFLGPYSILSTGMRPFGMDAGDFDLTVDPATHQAYCYFEQVHSAMICVELTEDYNDVKGPISSHFPQPGPPLTREAPAYFLRNDIHYLITSGTTWYYPNQSEVARAPSYHGPWTVLGDPHPTDADHTSFRSQISSVFKHPGKQDLYIAIADRWIVTNHGSTSMPAQQYRDQIDTSIADYVWLPIRFDGDVPTIEWLDEWYVDDYV